MWTKHSGEIFIKFLATKNPAVILMKELTFGNVLPTTWKPLSSTNGHACITCLTNDVTVVDRYFLLLLDSNMVSYEICEIDATAMNMRDGGWFLVVATAFLLSQECLIP
jgi:hypothetical protein